MFYVGLDLGQRSDYTALTVLEAPVYLALPVWTLAQPAAPSDLQSGWLAPAEIARGDWEQVSYARASDRQAYAIRHMMRFSLGTPYPEIIRAVAALLGQAPLAGRAALIVDATGVGRPVVDALRDAQLDPYAVTITGGDRVVRDGREVRVPKRDLAMVVQVLLQQRRLRFAAELPLLDVLKRELQSFEVKINPATAHDSYLSWREGAHDDLVLAAALSCWAVETDPPLVVQPMTEAQIRAAFEWRG